MMNLWREKKKMYWNENTVIVRPPPPLWGGWLLWHFYSVIYSRCALCQMRVSSKFSRKSEAFASEFLENLEELFSRYFVRTITRLQRTKVLSLLLLHFETIIIFSLDSHLVNLDVWSTNSYTTANRHVQV